MSRQYRPRLSKAEMDIVEAARAGLLSLPKSEKPRKELRPLPKPFKGNPGNVLVIGDIHEPFALDGYLEFCRETQERFDCGTVVFIGDVIDNHFSSFHATDPDGYGAGDELDRAIDKIAEWNAVFPKAYVCIGNHDRMAFRKAETGGVSKRWIKAYSDVLETPGWDFVDEVVIDDVNYNHGEGGTARTKMRKEHQSQVQGHLHPQAYIEYSVGNQHKYFGMQVGCGVDREAYALAYAKRYPKQAISCGVVLDNGTLPILATMDLD